MQRRLADAASRQEHKARDHAKSRETRNRVIIEAHGEGGSLREIAEAVGLSHPAVMKIVSGGDKGT